MNDDDRAERRSVRFSAFERSLEAYVNEVVNTNNGENARKAPRIVGDAFQGSIAASVNYHDYMSDLSNNGDAAARLAYHSAMANSYRELKK